MDPDYAQRRRLAIAAAVTVIVVPAFVLLNLGQSDDTAAEPEVTAVGTLPGAVAASPSTTPEEDTSAMGELEPGFVAGDPEPSSDEPPTIVVGAPTEAIEVLARFDRSLNNVERCYVPDAPADERITVTNVDNGQLVDCFNSIPASDYPDSDQAVMHTETFSAIADLTDSPVPVEVTW